MNSKIKISALSILVILALTAGFLTAREEAKVQKEIVYKVEKNPSLEIENISGWTKIASWGKDEILIEYTIYGIGDDTEEAQNSQKRIRVISNKSGNRVEIKVKYEKGGFLSFSDHKVNGYVNFNIKVPQDCRINSENVSGDVKIENIFADVNSSTTSGDTIIQSTKGLLKITSVSGDVTLRNHQGAIEGDCVSGEMDISDVISSVKAESVSGSVSIKQSKLSGLNLNTVSGDIILISEFTDKARVSLETVSGDIVLNILNNVGMDYSFSSFSGDLMLNLPGKGNAIRSKKLNGSYDSADGKIKIDINASTLSGDIKVESK